MLLCCFVVMLFCCFVFPCFLKKTREQKAERRESGESRKRGAETREKRAESRERTGPPKLANPEICQFRGLRIPQFANSEIGEIPRLCTRKWRSGSDRALEIHKSSAMGGVCV